VVTKVKGDRTRTLRNSEKRETDREYVDNNLKRLWKGQCEQGIVVSSTGPPACRTSPTLPRCPQDKALVMV